MVHVLGVLEWRADKFRGPRNLAHFNFSLNIQLFERANKQFDEPGGISIEAPSRETDWIPIDRGI